MNKQDKPLKVAIKIFVCTRADARVLPRTARFCASTFREELEVLLLKCEDLRKALYAVHSSLDACYE